MVAGPFKQLSKQHTYPLARTLPRTNEVSASPCDGSGSHYNKNLPHRPKDLEVQEPQNSFKVKQDWDIYRELR